MDFPALDLAAILSRCSHCGPMRSGFRDRGVTGLCLEQFDEAQGSAHSVGARAAALAAALVSCACEDDSDEAMAFLEKQVQRTLHARNLPFY